MISTSEVPSVLNHAAGTSRALSPAQKRRNRMSFLKNLISDAVSDGVGRGIRDAVGKAVETAVQPAADKLAGQAAEQIEQATQSLEKSTQAASAAQAEAASAAQSEADSAAQAASQAKYSGTASLEAALTGWAGAMQTAAGQAVQNMKECPKCGEIVTADHKFCPKCGTALPEKTIGEAYLCPKCGKQNLPETVYCVECGTRLPVAEEAHARQISKWEEWIPHYPKWDLGGEFELAQGDTMNGEQTVRLFIKNAGQQELNRYIALLKESGFIPAYDGDSDIYYKVVDGVCRSFDKTDAVSDDSVSVTFFVGDYDKRAEEREKKAEAAREAAESAKEAAREAAETAKDTAKAAADKAKGLFKKFF